MNLKNEKKIHAAVHLFQILSKISEKERKSDFLLLTNLNSQSKIPLKYFLLKIKDLTTHKKRTK